MLFMIALIIVVVYVVLHDKYENLRLVKKKVTRIKEHKNFSRINKDDYNTLRLIEYWLNKYPAKSFINYLKNYKSNPHFFKEVDSNNQELLSILIHLDGLKESVPLYNKSGRIKGFVRLKQQPKGA